MHIAIVTAGGAGMFCGSCMHDNTWARALMRQGHEVSLIPTYTPIRVDDHNESQSQVFMGGINVYLDARYRWWGKLPRFARHWLDNPTVIRWLTSRAVSNDARQLGELAVSMLLGEQGPHRAAIEELDRYISEHLHPDVVIFSNALLSGAVGLLKERFFGPVLCMLQGDDVFLDSLVDPYREQVTALVAQNAQNFDGFLTHSQFYRDYMAGYLDLPVDKISTLPLGIDFTGFATEPPELRNGPLTVGYFARIAPEKGLHHLAEGFARFHEQFPDARLKVGGYLGPQHIGYFEQSLARAGTHRAAITYTGSPQTFEEKLRFFAEIDVLSVPTEFLEPKGLYVLEALGCGVPVVQPEHGSFPELIAATQGGLLVPAKDPQALAAGLTEMTNPERRQQFAQTGWHKVRECFSEEAMVQQTITIAERYLDR